MTCPLHGENKTTNKKEIQRQEKVKILKYRTMQKTLGQGYKYQYQLSNTLGHDPVSSGHQVQC